MADTNGHALAAPPIPPAPVTLAPVAPPSPPAEMGIAEVRPADFLHAFRRRGLVCFSIGILLSAAAAAGVWFAQKPTFRASAILKLSATSTELVFDEVQSMQKFEIFQGTQRELAKSRFVMTRALRDEEVLNLGIASTEARPVDWLLGKIQVDTPKDTELMQISATTEEGNSAIVLANAVVDAYIVEVVDEERGIRAARLAEIQDVYAETNEKLRAELNKLTTYVNSMGNADTAALSTKQQLMMQSIQGLRNRLLNVETDLLTARQTLQAIEQAGDVSSEAAFQQLFQQTLLSDQTYRQLKMDKLNALRMQADAASSFKSNQTPDFTAKLIETIDQQIKDRESQVLEEVKMFPPLVEQEDTRKLKINQFVYDSQRASLEQNIAELESELSKLSHQSIEVEMMRTYIEEIRTVLRGIGQEREQLSVELNATPRVRVMREAKEAVPANELERVGLAGAAGLLAFLAPMALILFQDVRSKRVNTADDVRRLADLRIVGTVPIIPSQAIRRLSDSRGRGRYEYWQSMLAESVNRIASGLVAEHVEDTPRQILITSAVAGEGKTTLSTQLAMSLASSGRSVLLVDLDLRRPMIHRTFGASAAPGICEVLRGETELVDATQETTIPGLTVIPAGQCDRVALRLLGHESTASLLKELRMLADFVIVDGCPVLPLADTGFICPHVDAVLFAVRRDVSRLAQVRAAHEFVAKCGNEVLGAVVTEGTGTHYRDDRYYSRDL